MALGLQESNEAGRLSAVLTAMLVPFMLLAALGFLFSVAAHVASIAELTLPGGNFVWLLHVGVFVVWLPAVLVANRVTRGENRKDFWKHVLSGCPRWMRLSAYVLFGYAILNFVYFMATSSGHRPQVGDAPPSIIRGFSGHWMVFYGVAFMTLYSAIKRPQLVGRKVCTNGHPVTASNAFCPACGESLRGGSPAADT